MAGIKAKKWVTRKFEEKKWYRLVLTEEGEFATTLRIPTFDRLALEDKHQVIITDGTTNEVGYELNLTKVEKALFETTYKNYILGFWPIEEAKEPETSIVWK